MSDYYGLLSIVGAACCVLGFFLVALVVFSLAFRPRRPRGADVAGIAPPPRRGVPTQASLTRMEEEAARSTAAQPPGPKRVLPNGGPAAPAPSAPTASPGGPPAPAPSAPPASPGGPPPVPRDPAAPRSGPPPIPPGTRMLTPSVTSIAPADGEPPRKTPPVKE